MSSKKAALFMKAATDSLFESDTERGKEDIISKIDTQDSVTKDEQSPVVNKGKIEKETEPALTESEVLSMGELSEVSTTQASRVKPGKRRPQSTRKTEIGIKSMEKVDLPEEEKNLTVARTFSIDMETSNRLDAAVIILQNSGAIVDKRPITSSAFVRIAVKRELDRLAETNGEAFNRAIEAEINRAADTPVFKW